MEAVKGKEGVWYTEGTIHCQTEHSSIGSITGCNAMLFLPSPRPSTTLYVL
jgi:hypothetical protein